MNTYRILFLKGSKPQYVEADSVNGFQPTSDSYVFKTAGEVVAAIPKAVVVSVVKINNGSDEPS